MKVVIVEFASSIFAILRRGEFGREGQGQTGNDIANLNSREQLEPGGALLKDTAIIGNRLRR